MTRNLSGNIEDLDLDEVVRVIALSRRSGLLTVDSAEGRAELLLAGGRLLRAGIASDTTPLGHHLLVAGIVSRADVDESDPGLPLEERIRVIAERDEHPGLLVRVDDLIAEKLGETAARTMMFRTGTFLFQVMPDPTPPPRSMVDTAFTLPAGIDADEIARDVRQRKRDRRTGDAQRPAVPDRRQVDADKTELFIVDDDEAFLRAAVTAAGAAGVTAVPLQGARAAIDRFFALGAANTDAVMLVDLVMPRSNGRGLLGGLEVLRRAAEVDLAGRVFLAVDEEHEDASAIARALGAAGMLWKPSPTKQGSSDAHPWSSYFNPAFERLRREPLTGGTVDLAGELRAELGESAEEWETRGGRIVDEGVRNLQTLKALLGELNDPSFHEEIPLLLLRFASAFFVRGALFVYDESGNALQGLGGFGLGGADPGRLVHSIRIPIDADSVFSRCIRERAGVRQAFFDSEWNAKLSTSLGGPRPREAYCGPLISPSGWAAILYADNATDARPFPDMQLLEIFLQQAAAAMERQSMALKIKSMRGVH